MYKGGTMLKFNKKIKSLAVVLSILILISLTSITIISCKTRIGPGPGEIDIEFDDDLDIALDEIDAVFDDIDLIEVKGSGNITSIETDVEGFNSVEVIGEGVLIIEQGNSENLVIETDDNLMEYIKASISGEKLKIDTIGEKGYDLAPTDSIYYYLKVKDLEELRLTGAVNVRCESLQTSILDMDMRGVANVELSGEVDNLKIFIDGVGNLKGMDFLSEECSISGTGNADIVISVSEKLDIGFKGVGSIKYIGDPEVKEDIDGLVDVEKID
jgi:hypothetical protein